MSARGSALALLALLVAGCVLVIEDPDGWSVGDDVSGGSGSSSGGSGAQGAGPGVRCTSSEGRCSCDATEPGDPDDGTGPACGVDHPDWLCCGDKQYPAKNTSCECRALSCKTTSKGCDCFLSSSHGPDDHCEPEQGQICCRSLFSCACGPEVSCDESDRVTSCRATSMRCEDEQFKYCSPLGR